MLQLSVGRRRISEYVLIAVSHLLRVQTTELRKEGKLKVAFTPFCRCEFVGVFNETRSCEDRSFSNTRFGVAQAVVRPLRDCPCGASDSSLYSPIDVSVLDTFRVSCPWTFRFISVVQLG
jgi:hypothetical protein